MARFTFPASTGDPNVRYRFDTSSGSDTPAGIVTARSAAPIDGSIIRADVDGRLPALRGPDGVHVLYRKKLSYAGTVLETVTLQADQDPPEAAVGGSAMSLGALAAVFASLNPADSSYTYDEDGNVLTETVAGVTTTYTYNLDGSVATSTRAGVTRTYHYNADDTIASVV